MSAVCTLMWTCLEFSQSLVNSLFYNHYFLNSNKNVFGVLVIFQERQIWIFLQILDNSSPVYFNVFCSSPSLLLTFKSVLSMDHFSINKGPWGCMFLQPVPPLKTMWRASAHSTSFSNALYTGKNLQLHFVRRKSSSSQGLDKFAAIH